MEPTLFKRLWNYFRIASAKKQADKLHVLTNRRYYVIKIYNKIRVYDRAHIDFLINSGILAQRLRNSLELQKICIYFTK